MSYLALPALDVINSVKSALEYGQTKSICRRRAALVADRLSIQYLTVAMHIKQCVVSARPPTKMYPTREFKGVSPVNPGFEVAESLASYWASVFLEIA